jgi:hypothetical protein
MSMVALWFRRLAPLFAVLLAVTAVVPMGAAAARNATDSTGNSDAVQACQQGGWQRSVRADAPERTFTSLGECVAYEASGGAVVHSPCAQAALELGYDPSQYVIRSGTDGDDVSGDIFQSPELFCGFGGDDWVTGLTAGDVFIGGDGDDFVHLMSGGAFHGGEGTDGVFYYASGPSSSVEQLGLGR